MKRNIIYTIALIIIFIGAMILFKNEFTYFGFNSLISATAIIIILFYLYRTEILNTKKMIEDLKVVLAQLRKVQDQQRQEAETLLNDTIENLESVIGGGGIRNPPPK